MENVPEDYIIENIYDKIDIPPFLDSYMREEWQAQREERKFAARQYRTPLNPLPKHQTYHKPNWLRTRSNPKLR